MRKEKGGLGIKNIKVFNVALVGKWLRRKKNALWVMLLEAKYGRGDK